MNNSTAALSNATSQTDSVTKTVTTVFTWLDNSVRITSVLIHLAYIPIVLTHEKLRKRGLVFVHNTNFIGLFMAIDYAAWIGQTAPQILDPYWYGVVCRLAEAAWPILKFSKAYAILILGVYRVFAVFSPRVYKQITRSTWLLAIGCLLPWLVALLIQVISKAIAQTTYGTVLCSDGYSPIIQNSLKYFLMTTILGYILPIVLVVVLYFVIDLKLGTVRSRVHKSSPAEQSASHLSTTGNSKRVDGATPGESKNHKERRLLHQLVVLNSLEFTSALSQILINLYVFIPVLSTNFYFIRLICRLVSNSCQTAIPVISLWYHPFKFKLLPCKHRS